VLVVVTVTVSVVVLVVVLELNEVVETVDVVVEYTVLVTVVVELETGNVERLVEVEVIVVVLVVRVVVLVTGVPRACMASHSPLMLLPGVACHVNFFPGAGMELALTCQASNFSNAPVVSPAFHPAGGVQTGVPPWPMKPNRRSSVFVVIIVHLAGEFALAMDGSCTLGS